MGSLAFRFLKDRSGSSAIEYALMASFISLAIITTAMSIGTQVSDMFWSVEAGFPE